MDKKKFGQVSPCRPYLPFQKVWTFWNKKLLVIFTYFRFFQKELSLYGGKTFRCKITPFFLPKTLFAIILTGIFSQDPPTNTRNISMDIHIWPTYLQFFVQTFFSEKVWLESTLPTYSLDICPKFRSFFWDPLLKVLSVLK